jgi:hypothetical protein
VVSASLLTSWPWSAPQARTVCCCVDPRTTARQSSTSDPHPVRNSSEQGLAGCSWLGATMGPGSTAAWQSSSDGCHWLV